jgi:tetratricopeptide (TPR) repeat protein
VYHTAFSPDGRRVVTAGGQTARVWDAAMGQPVTPPLNHYSVVEDAAFSPDGRRVVTASADGTARVWDAATGQPVTPPLKHNAVVWHAAFSRDGRRVLTASGDGTARVWDAATGQPVTPPLKHNGIVRQAALSPDGRRVVTASDDQTARVWDAATGQPVTPPLKHNGGVLHADFSPDGRRVVTASQDQTARVWDLPTDERPAEDSIRLAEVLAGYQLDEQGGVVPLDGGSFNQRWETLHSKYAFAHTPEEIRAWHREEAAACAAAGLWLGAIQHLDVVLEADLANQDFRRSRAKAHAALAHWQEAAADFAKAQEGEANLQLAGWHAACLAAAGDWAAHRKACAALLAQYGKDVAGIRANDLAWYCVRFRKGPGDVLGCLKLAEQAVAASPKDANWLNTLGAVLYRAGRYADAIGKLQDGIKIRNDVGTASDWLFLALAHHKLGHADESKKWLTKAQQWIDQAPKEGANALPWDQRLELRLLRAEAEEAILSQKGKPGA